MKPLILLCLFYFIFFNSFSCINEYQTKLDGELSFEEYPNGRIWTRDLDSVKLKKTASKRLKKYQETDSIKYLSNYGVSLIYLGEYEQAKSTFIEIEKKSPNRYNTAANIGTVYELLNQPDSALYWIKKSLEIKPEAHFNSEWIHVKILEFKLKNNRDYSKSILDLDFGEGNKPINSNSYNLDSLKSELEYQLRERLQFIKPPNKIIGNILFDYGNIKAQKESIEAALQSFEQAKEFGYDSELLNKRIAFFNEMSKTAQKEQKKHEMKEKAKDVIRHNQTLFKWLILAFSIIALILIVIGIRSILKKYYK